MICKACGAPIGEGETSCPQCGTPVPTEGGVGFWDLLEKPAGLDAQSAPSVPTYDENGLPVQPGAALSLDKLPRWAPAAGALAATCLVGTLALGIMTNNAVQALRLQTQANDAAAQERDATLAEDLASLDARLSTLEDDLADLDGRMDGLEGDVGELTADLDSRLEALKEDHDTIKYRLNQVLSAVSE